MSNKSPKSTKVVGFRTVKRQPATGKGRILSATVVEKVERRFQVLEMRKKGYTLQEIAEALQVGPDTVRSDLQKVLSDTIKTMAENTGEARQLEVERFDAIIKYYWPLALAGNLAATAVLLQVSQQRRKLLA